jgi:hypothetical protein
MINKNKPLDDQIIEKIYKFEQKRTYLTLVRYAICFIVFLSLFLFGLFTTYSILEHQQTLDVLDLFTQPISVIRENIYDVIDILYIESPKMNILVAIGSFVLLLLTLRYIIKNKDKRLKKIKKIYYYFKTNE